MRACAKFIVGGEHSVVERGVAVAFPLHVCELSLQALPTDAPDTLNGRPLAAALVSPLRQLEEVIAQALAIPRTSRRWAIDSKIPLGGGLGSSAALCVAMARSLAPAARAQSVAHAALQGEKLFHARPSGVDPYVIAYAQPAVFDARGPQFRPLRTDAWRNEDLIWILVDSGEPHSTAQLQRVVGDRRRESPRECDQLMERLATHAQRMADEIEGGSPAKLGELMNAAHADLDALGVSTPALDDGVRRLRAHGALGAKLTGAGGGGFALALFRQSRWRAERAEFLAQAPQPCSALESPWPIVGQEL